MRNKKILSEIDKLPPGSSIMVSLKEKETKLKENTLKVRKEAERIVAEARAKAGKICDEARLMGNKEGRKLIKNGLSKAQEEAQAIEEESRAKIKVVQEQAQANLEQAVTLIVDKVTGKNREKQAIKG